MNGIDRNQQLRSTRGNEAAHRKIAELLERIEHLEAKVEELDARTPERATPSTRDRLLSMPVSQD